MGDKTLLATVAGGLNWLLSAPVRLLGLVIPGLRAKLGEELNGLAAKLIVQVISWLVVLGLSYAGFLAFDKFREPVTSKCTGQQICVVVIGLVNDGDEALQTKNVRASLRSLLTPIVGPEPEVIIIPRRGLDLFGGDMAANERKATAFARDWMTAQGAHLAVYGEVVSSGSLELNLITLQGRTEGPKRYLLDEKQVLDGQFGEAFGSLYATLALFGDLPAYRSRYLSKIKQGQVSVNWANLDGYLLRDIHVESFGGTPADQIKFYMAVGDHLTESNSASGDPTRQRKALTYLERALKTCQQSTRNGEACRPIYNNLGNAGYRLYSATSDVGDLDLAIDYYRSFLQGVTKDSNLPDWQVGQGNLASVLEEKAKFSADGKEVDAAVTAYEEVFETLKNDPEIAFVDSVAENLSNSLRLKGRLHEHVESVERSIVIDKRLCEAAAKTTTFEERKLRSRRCVNWATGLALHARLASSAESAATALATLSSVAPLVEDPRLADYWANLQDVRAQANLQWGLLNNSVPHLRKALHFFAETEKQWSRATNPADWAESQAGLSATNAALWRLTSRPAFRDNAIKHRQLAVETFEDLGMNLRVSQYLRR